MTPNEPQNAFTSRMRAFASQDGPPTFLQYIFPGISLKSILVGFMIVQLACYIAALIIDERALNPTDYSLLSMGASTFSLTVTGLQLWRLLTCCFLLPNLESLFFVIWIQWTMGASTEKKHGMPKFTAIIMASALTGAAASTLAQTRKITIGGAFPLIALFGFNLMECILDWGRIQNKDAVLLNILFMGFFVFYGTGVTGGDGVGILATFSTGMAMAYIIRSLSKSETGPTLPVMRRGNPGPGQRLGSN